MADATVRFTEFSRDPNNFEQIHANLRVPYTQFSTLIIDSLTTNACFEVLGKDDYLVFVKNGRDVIVEFDDNYSDLKGKVRIN